MTELLHKELVYDIVGCAMEVHSELGPGFLESVYEEALTIVFRAKGLQYKQQIDLRIKFRETFLKKHFTADLIVDDKVITELKAVAQLKKIDEAQLINYLKATGLKVGLLLNFGGENLEWKRFVY
jgi:GxxExxY protein